MGQLIDHEFGHITKQSSHDQAPAYLLHEVAQAVEHHHNRRCLLEAGAGAGGAEQSHDQSKQQQGRWVIDRGFEFEQVLEPFWH